MTKEQTPNMQPYNISMIYFSVPGPQRVSLISPLSWIPLHSFYLTMSCPQTPQTMAYCPGHSPKEPEEVLPTPPPTVLCWLTFKPITG